MTTTQNHDHPGELYVLPVQSKKDLKRFIRVPWSIYAGDPCWIPPLLFERKEHLSDKNPYFKHARWQAWVAFHNGKPVGRISAQVDQLRLERFQDETGQFGFLEAPDDPAIFRLLLETACDWLREQGIKRVQGPFNLSINDECGLLVKGFDSPPSVMMGHALPYYAGRIEALGYSKAKDLLAYRVPLKSVALPGVMQKLAAKFSKRISTRSIRGSHLQEDLVILRDLFNDAWSDNWGFTPFTVEEFEHLGKTLAQLVDLDFIQIASLDGEPAAMIVALPNLNEAARDLNGRLLPLGWMKLLWRLKRHKLRTARVKLMGVRRIHQKSRVGVALAQAVIEAVRFNLIKQGFDETEMSWILEDNADMRNIIELLGGEPYKCYRIYQRDLD
jgi:GNAT superfamily N-acetyltransferase